MQSVRYWQSGSRAASSMGQGSGFPEEVRPMSTGTTYASLGTCIPRSYRALVLAGPLVLLVGASCTSAMVDNAGSGPRGGSQGQGGSGNGSGGGSGGSASCLVCGLAGSTGGTGGDTTNVPHSKNCGDGVLDDGELCDDGVPPAKKVGADAIDTGCNAFCQIEANFICPTPGRPCVDQRVCGNNVLTSDEVCDDGNTVSGDGCSGDCKTIEPGWQCHGAAESGRSQAGSGSGRIRDDSEGFRRPLPR